MTSPVTPFDATGRGTGLYRESGGRPRARGHVALNAPDAGAVRPACQPRASLTPRRGRVRFGRVRFERWAPGIVERLRRSRRG